MAKINIRRNRNARSSDAHAIRIARLAALLARDPNGLALTGIEIANDAAALDSLSFQVRSALEAGNNTDRLFRKIQSIIKSYDATIERRLDLDGMVVGIHFQSPLHRCGYGNAIFLS